MHNRYLINNSLDELSNEYATWDTCSGSTVDLTQIYRYGRLRTLVDVVVVSPLSLTTKVCSFALPHGTFLFSIKKPPPTSNQGENSRNVSRRLVVQRARESR